METFVPSLLSPIPIHVGLNCQCTLVHVCIGANAHAHTCTCTYAETRFGGCCLGLMPASISPDDITYGRGVECALGLMQRLWPAGRLPSAPMCRHKAFLNVSIAIAW